LEDLTRTNDLYSRVHKVIQRRDVSVSPALAVAFMQ
jgi:hypothetical protein